jgi:hypothetical protein
MRGQVSLQEHLQEICSTKYRRRSEKDPEKNYLNRQSSAFIIIRKSGVTNTEHLISLFFVCNETNLMHYLRICGLFSHYTSTCFGLASSPSSGGNNVYMHQMASVVRFS